MGVKLSKLSNVYKKYGFRGFCRKLWAYVKANYFDRVSFAVFFAPRKYKKAIERILADEQYDRIVLWRSSFGYKVPLFQRPQHIATNLSKRGCLVLYEVTTMTDRVKTLKRHHDRLYLFNFNNTLLNKILMKRLASEPHPKYVQLYSTDWKLSVENIKDYISRGFGFIYEYIDHISPELAGTKELPKNIIEKYDYVMSDDRTFVIVTADLLRDDVLSKRGERRVAVSSNGVDHAFFRTFEDGVEPDDEFKAIQAKGKPILMYYGALAAWFDYDLVRRMDATGRYSIVLIGIKYDESYDVSGIGELENVYFLGPRDYTVLKYYARCADVLMIPFKINDITRSTNPVKLFEYMALGKPIVTTDMNECRKYSSVLIGEDHDDFLGKLDEALALRGDAEYASLLDREARENDWSYKADAIIDLIKRYE